MHTAVPFLIALVSIGLMTWRWRIPPFLALVGAGLLYGVLAGMGGEEIISAATRGAGTIFAVLAIVIFCGACIGALLQEAGHLDRIIADLRRMVRWPAATAGVTGFVLSIPMMCCITAFILAAPIVSRNTGGPRRQNLLFLTAVASVVSFVLIYPAPVTYTVISLTGLLADDPWSFDIISIPFALALLGGAILVASHRIHGGTAGSEAPEGGPGAWIPFAVIFLFIVTGLAVHSLEFLSNVSIALLAGVVAAILVVPGTARYNGLRRGSRRAGVIIFDLAGAGAFGGVMAASAFPAQVSSGITAFVPTLLFPLVLTAVIQAAVGSRVVSASIVAAVVAETGVPAGLDPTGFLLMIAGGTCFFPAFSDPYFWLVKRATGAGIRDVLRGFTLPLTIIGCIIGGVGAVMAALA
ncbi:MAG: GntP family permease [Methanoculleaceae archaeon]